MSAPETPTPAQQEVQPAQPIYVERRSNGLGVAGFVCGLLSAILGVIPLLFVFAFPLGLLGIVFGAIGWRRAANEPARGGKELSIAGVVLGVIGLVLAIMWVAAINAIVSESD